MTESEAASCISSIVYAQSVIIEEKWTSQLRSKEDRIIVGPFLPVCENNDSVKLEDL